MSDETPVVVQLGRNGDLLNILPLMQEYSNEGRRGKLVVAEEFEQLLDGVSYVDRLVFRGKVDDIRVAAEKARKRFPDAKVTQTWGADWRAPRRTENFMREPYFRADADTRFEQLSLVIDRRSTEREAALVDGFNFVKDKPILLVNVKATSTPFHRGANLLNRLEKELGAQFQIVNIALPKVHRLYDLLGLMDIASCLVSCDSMPLHLANASAVPVCALVCDDSWNATLRRPNHIYRSTYADINFTELVAAIRKTARRNERQKIVHTYPTYSMSDPDQRRHDTAAISWGRTYGEFGGWIPNPVFYTAATSSIRNSKNVLGDTRALPFVKDVIDDGMKHTKLATDIVVLTNSDVGFSPGVTEKIRRLCAVRGAAFAYRFDFDKIESAELTNIETVSGRWWGGLDLFCFTREFWEAHKDKFPDSVMGSTGWDLHFRDVIKNLRGGEVYGSHWHENHASVWKAEGPKSAANVHNTALYKKFLATFDRTRPYSI